MENYKTKKNQPDNENTAGSTDIRESGSLIRKLGLFDSIMIMTGIIIGSGIFVTTGIMAEKIPSPVLILLAWVVGGIFTLAGALTYAELGASMPLAGGQYVYIKEAYGQFFGFLFGWLVFFVYVTGGIAGLAMAFAEYFGYFVPSLSTSSSVFSSEILLFGTEINYTLSYGQLIAVAAILLLSVFNYLGLVLGKNIQNFLSVIKIGIIFIFIVLGFLIGKGTPVDLSYIPSTLSTGQIISGFSIALVAVFWSFDGWNNINFVAGEIKDPKRNIPLTLIIGTLGVTVLYVLVNYIYLYAVPVNQMAGEVRIAEKATSALFGGHAGSVISLAVIISTLGAINGSILTGPRVYYAMAKDKLFFKKAADINFRFRTPGFAILIQAVWATLLTLTGTFEQLITYTIFASIIFWIAAALSVFTLRKKFPDLPRPYKTWGYPAMPILFILVSSAILINTLIQKPFESVVGIILIFTGIPMYFYWKKEKGKNLKHH